MSDQIKEPEVTQEQLEDYVGHKNAWGGQTSNGYIHYKTVRGEEFSFPLHTNINKTK